MPSTTNRPMTPPAGALTPADATWLYGLDAWGQGYFAVNARGHVVVRPDRTAGREVDLAELIDRLRREGVATPVLLRFPQLLAHRAREVKRAFDLAIEEAEYGNDYRCVYPIKVNQQRHVVERIRDIGAELGFGLEAGAKPELLAVLGLTAEQPDTLIVCNGFKDDEYIETVTLARKMGRNIIPVIERRRELDTILRFASKHNVEPRVGLRVKLASAGAGRWEASGGMRSKFGLLVSEAVEVVERLKREGLADSLVMLHCHVGSQINDLRSLQHSITELTRVYTELRGMGAGLTMLDIGGGLGVDYDGTGTSSDSSVNYSLDRYAQTVVQRIKLVCEEAGQPHPRIISESGRALVAYWSLLIFDVLGVSECERPPEDAELNAALEDNPPWPLRELVRMADAPLRAPEALLRDALDARNDLVRRFTQGEVGVRTRVLGDKLFRSVGRRAIDALGERGRSSPELAHLTDLLCDLYFCNMSIFQSIPDLWALGQKFPFCPIHRLDEAPTRRGVLADITCDSDGEVNTFPSPAGAGGGLRLHELRENERYHIGAFLVGAYQEILGDLHNLLGDSNAVHVLIDDDNQPVIETVIRGDSVADVLGYVQISAPELRDAIEAEMNRAVEQKTLTRAVADDFLAYYEQALAGYTYLEESES